MVSGSLAASVLDKYPSSDKRGSVMGGVFSVRQKQAEMFSIISCLMVARSSYSK